MTNPMARAWLDAADDLGIRVTHPFKFVAPSGAEVETLGVHLPDFGAWYARVPQGRLLVLQSNDYFACREHVNCVPDLAAFRAQAPLVETLFAGERRMRRYTRFMLIGRK